jgi:hypothetical protein
VREVDVLKHAVCTPGCRFCKAAARHALVADRDDLARFNFSQKLCAKHIERDSLACDHKCPVACHSDHQGTPTPWVACRFDAIWEQEHKAEGTFESAERVGEWIRRALAFGLREHVNDALGVTRCLKDVTGEFKLLAEQVVVDEIAIVRDSDLSSAVSHQDGLCVARDAAACGAVAIVPDCAAYARCAQGCERCFIEDFRNKAHARDAC